jgi:FixJ family two-component response regulator
MSKARCVFVVDDDPSARNGLARLLRTAGHVVRDFASADEFLESLDPEMRGCLVLDTKMRGISMADLHLELQKHGSRLRVIIVTADDDSETRAQARRMNAEGFFRKPVDATALLDAIAWALRQGHCVRTTILRDRRLR